MHDIDFLKRCLASQNIASATWLSSIDGGNCTRMSERSRKRSVDKYEEETEAKKFVDS